MQDLFRDGNPLTMGEVVSNYSQFSRARSKGRAQPALRCVIDVDGRMVSVSESLASLLEYRPSELRGRNISEFVYPDDLSMCQSHLEETFSRFQKSYLEVRLVSRSGQVHWIGWSGGLDEHSGLCTAYGRDITDLREQQARIETVSRVASGVTGQKFFETLAKEFASSFQVDQVAISRLDENRKAVVLAHASNRGTHLSFEYELSGTACQSVVISGGFRLFSNPATLFPGDKRFTGRAEEIYIGCPIVSVDGEKMAGLIWVIHSHLPRYVQALEHAMTALSTRIAAEFERERREAELERRVEYSQGLLKTSPDMLFVLDENFIYRDCYYHKAEDLAALPAALIGSSIDDILPRDVGSRIKNAILEARATGSVADFEYDLKPLDGVQKSYHGRAVTTSNGLALLYVRNVTEEKRLRAEQARLTSIIEATTDIIAVVSRSRELVYLNPAARKFFGIDETTDLSGISIDKLQPAWARKMRDSICVPLAIQHGVWAGETALTDRSGKEVQFSQTIVVHRAKKDQRVDLLSTILRDISERKEFETKIAEQQMQILASAKMAALGEMASGIAHEINNPLSVILARAEILRDVSLQGSGRLALRAQQAAESTVRMVDRIARIVHSLRFFARDGEQDPFETRSIQSIVDETLELCKTRFKNHDVRIDVQLPLHEILVHCRPVQISQVILNLLSNAFDAVRNAADPDRWVQIDVTDGGEFIEVAVMDSGAGVRPEIADKIMQPFFTTKEVGEGTGLGLSISRGIVSDHGGTLELDFASYHTRFFFRLPFDSPSRQEAPPSYDRHPRGECCE